MTLALREVRAYTPVMARVAALFAAAVLLASAALAKDFSEDPLGAQGAALRESFRDFKSRPDAFVVPVQHQVQERLNYDPAFPPALRAQMNSDLGFLDGLRTREGTPLHRRVFGMVRGDHYLTYLTRRVHAVAAQSCGPIGTIACINTVQPNKMLIAPGYTTLGVPMIYRLMVIMHEARHTETADRNWIHENCPEPFRDDQGRDIKGIFSGVKLEGLPACDTTPMGSYGVSIMFIKNIEKSCPRSTCTDKLRMDAGLYADDTLLRISDARAKQALRHDLYR